MKFAWEFSSGRIVRTTIFSAITAVYGRLHSSGLDQELIKDNEARLSLFCLVLEVSYRLLIGRANFGTVVS